MMANFSVASSHGIKYNVFVEREKVMTTIPRTVLYSCEVTTYTLPEEIGSLEAALAYRDKYKRTVERLPKTMPARAKKAYAERLRIAEALVMKYAEV